MRRQAIQAIHEIDAAASEADIYLCLEREEGGSVYADACYAFGRKAVRVFDSAAACVSEAFDTTPRLILFDLRLAGPYLQLHLQRLRNDRATCRIPVIVRSGGITAGELSRLVHCGASAVMTADAHPAQVILRARQWLDGTAQELHLSSVGPFKAVADAQAKACREVLPGPEQVRRICEDYTLDIDQALIGPEKAGGDLWDVQALDPARLALVCADVCGHGLEAVPHSIRLSGLLHSKGFDRGNPALALQWLNARLYALMPAGKFAAMAYAVIDVEASRLTYACSAFMPPLIRLPKGRWEVADAGGLPLGFVEHADFDLFHADFPVGAQLLLYSDAVVETPVTPNNIFDSPRLAEFLNRLPQEVTRRSAGVTRAITAALKKAGEPLSDDLTLVCVTRL